MVILCATVIFAVALLCLFAARMTRKTPDPDNTTVSAEESMTVSVSRQTDPQNASSESEHTLPSGFSEQSGELSGSLEEQTSESVSLPLLVEEIPPVRRIENFLLWPKDSDEYKLARLLIEDVPPVRILIEPEKILYVTEQAPETQTAASETQTAAPETQASTPEIQTAAPESAETPETTIEETAADNTNPQNAERADTAKAERAEAFKEHENAGTADTSEVFTQDALDEIAAEDTPVTESETAAKATTAEASAKDTAADEIPAETLSETQTSETTSAVAAPATVEIKIPARYMDAEGSVSLYYKDLSDGDTLVFNPDKIQYAASMIKIVYIYALLSAADKDEADLDQTVVYNAEKMYQTGSGNFASVADGTKFSVWELIEHTVVYSDNTAYGMLLNLYGYRLFTDAMEEAGLPSVYRDWWRTPVGQYGAFFETLYGYLTSGSENGERLCGLMCRSTQTVMLKNALKPEKVAHKYGWDVGSYCDGAVVLNEAHPYIVVFMSNLDEGHIKRANTEFIYEAGGLIKRIHDKKYEEAEKEEETDAETLPL